VPLACLILSYGARIKAKAQKVLQRPSKMSV